MWGLGCLIWEVFNGVINSPSSLKSLGNVSLLTKSMILEQKFINFFQIGLDS